MGVDEDLVALTKRVEQLEARLAGVEAAEPMIVAPAPAVVLPPPPGAVPTGSWPPPARPPAPQHRKHPDTGQHRERVSFPTSETILKWSGLTLVVLATVFLVGAAISRGWIGPELQLAAAAMAGLGLLVAAFRLRRSSIAWARTLAVGGAIVLPICAAAANAGLDLIGNYPALVILAVVVVSLIGVARELPTQAVAAVAAIGSIILPFWISDDVELPLLVLGGWVAVTAMLFSAVSLIQGWTSTRLITTGWAALVLLTLAIDRGGESLSSDEKIIALAVLGLVALTAWIGPALERPGRPDPLVAIDQRVVLYLPLWVWGVLGAIIRFDSDGDLGVAGIVLAVTMGGAAAIGFVFAPSRFVPRLVGGHLLGAGLLIAVSVAVITTGPALLVAWAAQGAATAYLASRLDDVTLRVQAGLLSMASLMWTSQLLLGGLLDPLEGGELLATLFVVALLVGAALYTWRSGLIDVARPLAAFGWIGSLAWLGALLIHGSQGQVLVSMIWAVAAATAILIGVRTGDRQARGLGLATLAVVLAKLLTVDLAAVDTLWRVGLFFVIGAGLLRLGYLLPKLPNEPVEAPADESTSSI